MAHSTGEFGMPNGLSYYDRANQTRIYSLQSEFIQANTMHFVVERYRMKFVAPLEKVKKKNSNTFFSPHFYL